MTILVFITIFIVLFAAIAGPIVFLQTRKQRRIVKNYERGLKMVPLLIHLPPPSEDTEGGGRDIRDVTDENISKAQIIYGIISSTLQKGFKAKFYGQRHFAFEIVASKGFVYFYAAVPVALVDVVKQAVVSAYPSARLEEAPEHNIFNPVGKTSATVGGQFNLKESYAYPIATFQDLKRDSMQALLNALSTLDREDGVGIQILMRPADPAWTKSALEAANKKRKGEDGGKKAAEQLMSLGKDVAIALVKTPEAKEGKKDDKKDLSGIDQAVIDAIENKTRQPGYEVLLRVVVSSNITQRSQAILNNIIAAFSLYDAPGRNGFKFEPSKDVEDLTTSYILRIFPQTDFKNILNTVELATIFHFPEQKSIPTSQLERQSSKQVDAPRNMPDEGLLLGYNVFRGVKKPIRLSNQDRARHMYAVGQTGTGKSTFLENLALQDMLSGRGFAFVDPHGDTAEKLLAMVPKERTEDIIYFSPSDMEYPLGLNLFEHSSPDQKDFIIQEVLNMLYKLYDPQRQGIMGPRYEHLFRNAALTVMADPEGGTFVDIPKLFRDQAYVKQKLQYVKDQNVIEFWQKEMPQSQRSNEFGEVVSWFVSKFGAFLSNEMMRNIIGQTKSSFDIRNIMDDGKILLVNLSKGRLGQLNMQLLGMIFVMKFQAAAMSRANIPESERRDFSLYVDEFQNFSTDSFASILSEARKYHLDLIVANQYTTQLSEEIRDAVFGNTGTLVSFRLGQDEDAEALAKRLRPAFDTTDLLRMPSYNAGVRMLIHGVPTQPFSMATLPPLGNPNQKLAEALKQLSAAKYGRPKAKVEAELFERLATKTPPAPSTPPSFGSRPASPFGTPGAQPLASPFNNPPQTPFGQPMPGARPVAPPPAQSGAGSFLNQWMDKRKAAGPLLRPNPWQKTPPPPVPGPSSGTGPTMPPAVPTFPQPAPMMPGPVQGTTPAPFTTAPVPHDPLLPAHTTDNNPEPAVPDLKVQGRPISSPHIKDPKELQEKIPENTPHKGHSGIASQASEEHVSRAPKLASKPKNDHDDKHTEKTKEASIATSEPHAPHEKGVELPLESAPDALTENKEPVKLSTDDDLDTISIDEQGNLTIRDKSS